MNATPTVRTFAPEQWGQFDLFSTFYAGTHKFDEDTKRAISGVENHMDKAITLYHLASKLAPNLARDQEELQEKGYTAAVNSKEFSAVIEEVFTELYSSVDCSRKIIVAIYRKCRRMPQDSTRKLFQRVKEGALGTDFPDPLNVVVPT